MRIFANSCVECIAATCTLAFGGCVFAQADPLPAPFDISQLAHCVEAARSQVTDFSVSFRCDADAAPANYAAARLHRTVKVKGARIFVDHIYSQMPEYEGPTFRLASSFDSNRTLTHLVHMRRATLKNGVQRELSTKGMGFFDLAMWNPAATGVGGYNEMDLHSVLVSPRSAVRPTLEDIDGHACMVVDQRSEQTDGVAFTVWVDLNRGFLPIQQRYFDSTNGRIVMEFFIDVAHETQPGIWFPLQGRKITSVLPGVPECSQRIEYVTTVDDSQGPQPAIAVNTGLDDTAFSLEAELPPGIVVLDIDADNSWTVVNANYQRLGESFDTQIANYRASDKALDQRLTVPLSSATPESRTSWSASRVYLGVGACLTSVGLAGFWMRRRGSC